MPNKLQGIRKTIGPVRFSFVNVYEKVQFNNNEPQYSLRALIPKENTELVNQIQAAINQAKDEAKNKIWGGAMPEDLAVTIHDGDKSGRAEEAGHWCLNTNNKNRQPGIVFGSDQHRQREGEEVKSGDYGLINVTFKAYDYGKKGIGTYLNSVWKTKNGESLAGASTPEEDFKDVDTSKIEFDEFEIDPLTGKPLTPIDDDFEFLAGDDVVPF